MAIPQSVIDEILTRTDIVDVVSSVVALKRTGSNYKGLCPFHNEKTPSFTVNTDKQIYYCFGCGVGGDAINFLMRQEALSFPEAIDKLAQPLNITWQKDSGDDEGLSERTELKEIMQQTMMFYERTLQDPVRGAEALAYLHHRGLSQETIQKFHLGFASGEGDYLFQATRKKRIALDKLEKCGLLIKKESSGEYYDRFRHRVIFPIWDSKGNTIAFGGRAMGEAMPKYLNSPEGLLFNKGQILYGFHLAKKAIVEQKRAILVEGYMDLIQLVHFGVENVVATLGTAFSKSHARLLKRFTDDVIILFDSDSAGQKAALRAFDILLEEGLTPTAVLLPGAKDPDDFLSEFGLEAFLNVLQNQSLDCVDFKINLLKGNKKSVSANETSRVIQDVFASLAKVDNQITQSLYLQKVSSRLAVNLEAVQVEFRKYLSKVQLGHTDISKEDSSYLPQLANKDQSAEAILLKLLLTDEKYFQQIRDCQKNYGIEFSTLPLNTVLDVLKEKGYLKENRILSCIEDEDLRSQTVQILMLDYLLDNPERNLNDALKKIVLEDLNDKQRTLLSETHLDNKELMLQIAAINQKKQRVLQEGVLYDRGQEKNYKV